jgi:hypothetical protein
MTRSTKWEPVGSQRLAFDAGHPQGMVRIDGTWWISTVDLDARKGWVLAVDGSDGTLRHRIEVGDPTRYHPGGMDFDGAHLWIASSEYRPRSSAVVERLDPRAGGRPEEVFRVDDHIGAIVKLGPTADAELVGWTWGSRRFRRWRQDGTERAERRNPAHFVDYQDGQWLGDELVLCGGVATVALAGGAGSLGGLGLLDAATLTMVREVPFPRYSPVTQRAATQNPLFAEIVDGAMLLHLLPDDGAGTIFTYATPLLPA